MTVTPSTAIYLCTTPLERDYKNQITFANVQAQQTYFNSVIGRTFTDYRYVKKDDVIYVNANIDNIMEYNYLFYRNNTFTNKIFYCFITNMEYINENTTQINIETDVFQTYMFDIVYKKCFVEREHVNDDTVGLHTIPEDLETGEWIVNSHVIDDAMDNILEDLCYVFSTSKDAYETDSNGKLKTVSGGLYNGIYSGNQYFRCDNKNDVNSILQQIAQIDNVDIINGLFMAPKILAQTIDNGSGHVLNSNTTHNYNNAISKQTTLNGYTPKNKKLLCHLFNYLVISNNNGSSYNYHYEDFGDSTCNFIIRMALSPGCSIRMTPLNYKGCTEADDYSINMGKLPICNFNCDMYTNWLTQHSINIGGVQISTDAINIGTSQFDTVADLITNSITGNIMGGVQSGVHNLAKVANSMITKKQHELIAPQVRGNLNCGDVITSSNKNNFHFYKMSIRSEFATIIDNYFDLYGYKVNSLKVPNITGRNSWNFVKTIDCNFEGNIPQNYLQKIRNIFDNGITLWHTTDVGNYDLNNGII